MQFMHYATPQVAFFRLFCERCVHIHVFVYRVLKPNITILNLPNGSTRAQTQSYME